jgi:hypothetical protein
MVLAERLDRLSIRRFAIGDELRQPFIQCDHVTPRLELPGKGRPVEGI